MNIYFVCTGNTCRSPMAEAIFKAKRLPNIEVRSAGIYALEGGEMSENAQRVLNSENIPHEHISRQVTVEDIEWADLILTMTTVHKELLVRSYEVAMQKTYTLKEYVTPYTAPDVSDPYGGDLHTYKQTFFELRHLIEELVQKQGGANSE
ncbi:low molecular weight protein arginine phosphatase [Metasolibacillus sp. FSL H7-0170]|uniref:low molecular weight protein arginine phosphatase n=1 Tax=Metasolibacillus sp. FSL H7-0170 TaxID=2921431 RepID=UPI003158DA22